MRCTRCDGLAVPQAVGIDAEGRVVFGWCPRCLVETHCDLVEIPAKGIQDLKLSFTPPPQGPAGERGASRPPLAGVDQSIWLVGLVGFLMVAWGSTIIGAGILMGTGPGLPQSPLGNGSRPVLRVGGAATILMGLMFLTMAANRDREFRRRLVRLVRWGGPVLSVVIGLIAIATGKIYANPLAAGWIICLPLILSLAAFLIDERTTLTARVNPWEFPVVSYTESIHPEKPKKRI